MREIHVLFIVGERVETDELKAAFNCGVKWCERTPLFFLFFLRRLDHSPVTLLRALLCC